MAKGKLTERQKIFISSSSDLVSTRQRISEKLDLWLEENGVDNLISPYLWEKDTKKGKLLSDRMRVQEQLVDTITQEVLLTVCIFGEKCGLPLHDKLPEGWEDRVRGWLAGQDGKGLVHPWPKTIPEQNDVLAKGGFPLTGTIFELISAHNQDTHTLKI